MHRRESSMVDTTTTTTKVSQRRRTPSFSSTLLDTIYRSIDESSSGNDPSLCHFRETKTVKKQSHACMEGDIKVSSLRRAIMIENWVEKQSNYGSVSHFNSTSSSSDSSNGGIFSSSEAESSHKEKSRRSKPVKFEKPMPFERKNFENNNQEKAKRDNGGGGGGFTKTKLKALKIYGELKKVKQPISPGARITNFINSIFNANAKKVKICSDGVSGDVNFQRKTKSTASSPSFSRSCLSNKTPSSTLRGNNNNNNNIINKKKRSVKFCPVSVIVDEDCRPCGHKCIYKDEDPGLMSKTKVSSRKDREKSGVSSSNASDYLRSYHQRRGGIGKLDLRGFIEDYDDEEEEDEDDALSCSSSDLFELDHLIGIGRYREELPVYETTRLKSNQAIVNGFLL